MAVGWWCINSLQMYILNIQKQISVIGKSAHFKKERKRESLWLPRSLSFCTGDHMDAISLPKDGKRKEGRNTQTLRKHWACVDVENRSSALLLATDCLSGLLGLIFVTVLWQCHSHTTQFSHIKFIVQCCLYFFSGMCNSNHSQF